MDYLNGLTEDSVLNKVRYIRDYELTDLDKKDSKTVKEWEKTQKVSSIKKKKIKYYQRKKKTKLLSLWIGLKIK